jgi:hypothetical protein
MKNYQFPRQFRTKNCAETQQLVELKSPRHPCMETIISHSWEQRWLLFPITIYFSTMGDEFHYCYEELSAESHCMLVIDILGMEDQY